MRSIKMRNLWILAGVILLFPGLYYGYLWVFVALAMSGVVADDTFYAEGFTDEGFVQVEIGWRVADVIRTLGLPLSVDKLSPDNHEKWYYSRRGTYGWRIFTLEMKQGLVIDKTSEWEPG